MLKFLVDDTHYRNLFETHTGSGSLDKTARSSWEVKEGRGSEERSVWGRERRREGEREVYNYHIKWPFNTSTIMYCSDTMFFFIKQDRLFNNLYRGSAPVDRVKYGVLNIGMCTCMCLFTSYMSHDLITN